MDDAVGGRLREARTRRRLTLSDVEEAIKIRPGYLRAIENDQWDQLPGDAYAHAFIRTYGKFLGLDGDRLAEEYRKEVGTARPGERLARVDPRPRRAIPVRGGGPRISPAVVTAAVIVLVIAAALAIGLSSGGETNGSGGEQGAAKGAKHPGGKGGEQAQSQPAPRGHRLALVATAEVWVCLLGGGEKPLVDGVILEPGEREGPFRSGSFRLALGNGAVTISVDGKQQNLPKPSSPIGFKVDSKGAVHELHQGERPTCT